jgi:hypothetical protein
MAVDTTYLYNKRPTVVLFTIEGCIHCKNSEQEFKTLKTSNNVHVIHYHIDGENKYIEKRSEFKITGYPSIFIFRDEQWYIYNGDRTEASITNAATAKAATAKAHMKISDIKPSMVQTHLSVCASCPTVIACDEIVLDENHVHFHQVPNISGIYIYYPNFRKWYSFSNVSSIISGIGLEEVSMSNIVVTHCF